MKNTDKAFIAGEYCSSIAENIISKRRSVRRFSDKEISPTDIDILIKAGINAPSGSNWQNQRFLIITDKTEIEEFGKIRFVWPYKTKSSQPKEKYPAGIIGFAKAIIIVFSDSLENDRRGLGEYYIWESLETQNCSASIENILIQSTAMGLASCWVSASDGMSYTRMLTGESWRKVLRAYAIPSYYKIQGIVLLGHPLKKDDYGFAEGEKNHGATVWKSIERREAEYYIIKKNESAQYNYEEPKFSQKIKIRTYRKLIRTLIHIVQNLDQKIHNIEIPLLQKYIK